MEKMLGVMLDCSRNAVMSVQGVKNYADIIAKMGYNTLMLYTEDTYEIPSQPYFGHLRGRFSQNELRELDKYCAGLGIELVPCIQTLAHLENMFKWYTEYENIRDCDEILLAGEEKTYALIEAMIESCASCFSSKKIHIGMDEAYNVGLGKYLKKHGFGDRFDIINDHLHRVCAITDKYGFEPMIWSDMFCKLALNITDQYADVNTQQILQKARLPENITLVYWDYYSTDYDRYVRMIRTNKMFGRKVIFAGGAWIWKSFAPRNCFSINANSAALRACRDEGIDGVIMTVWGDDSTECSRYSILPTLMQTAAGLQGLTDEDGIKAAFEQAAGCSYDSFMLFDMLDMAQHKPMAYYGKCLLYNDLLLGTRNYMCKDVDRGYYGELARKLHNAENKGGFDYLFDSYEKLARVLEIKCDLSVRIKSAYLHGDRDALCACIHDCEQVLMRLNDFSLAYRKAWMRENKPHGLDIFDIRIGGLIQRIISCKMRLEEYIRGETESIPELLEPDLPSPNGGPHWYRLVTPNQLTYGR